MSSKAIKIPYDYGRICIDGISHGIDRGLLDDKDLSVGYDVIECIENQMNAPVDGEEQIAASMTLKEWHEITQVLWKYAGFTERHAVNPEWPRRVDAMGDNIATQVFGGFVEADTTKAGITPAPVGELE